MATQVQRRRGTKTEHNSFTGALGEITVETTNDRLHVHDGSKTGGFPIGNFQDIINQAFVFADGVQDTSGDYIVTLAEAPSAYTEGMCIWIKPDTNNAGACDINVNSLGLKNINKDDGTGTLTELEADDIRQNIPVELIYDGTQFIAQLGGGGGNDWTYESNSVTGDTPTIFSGLPSGVTEIEIFSTNLRKVSGNTTEFQIQIGDSGGIETSGYDSWVQTLDTAPGSISANDTGHFAFARTDATGDLANDGCKFFIRLAKATDGSELWFITGQTKAEVTTYTHSILVGNKTLTGEITQGRLNSTSTAGDFSGTVYVRYR